jgi:hypothetical protein
MRRLHVVRDAATTVGLAATRLQAKRHAHLPMPHRFSAWFADHPADTQMRGALARGGPKQQLQE